MTKTAAGYVNSGAGDITSGRTASQHNELGQVTSHPCQGRHTERQLGASAGEEVVQLKGPEEI